MTLAMNNGRGSSRKARLHEFKSKTEGGDTTLSIQGKDVFVSLPTGSGKAFATTHCQ